MKTIEYKGMEFEYDDSVLAKWSFIRRMYRASADAERAIVAAEGLLPDVDGAAEKLGDSAEAMAGLVSAIFEDMAEPGKNSRS